MFILTAPICKTTIMSTESKKEKSGNLLVHFLEGRLAHKHEVDAATSAPKVSALTVHLCALQNLRCSINRSTNSGREHPEATARSSVLSRVYRRIHHIHQGQLLHWSSRPLWHRPQVALDATAIFRRAFLPNLGTR